MVEVELGEKVSYSDFAVNSLTILAKSLWLPEAVSFTKKTEEFG